MTRSLLFALAVVATLTLPRLAFAGCGDGMVARVDTADVITFDTGGHALEAKLHGAYGWEASPDGWASHPVGGKQLGFVHLGCAQDDSVCVNALAELVALSGTMKPMFGFGRYTAGVSPEGVHLEGDASTASVGVAWPNRFQAGSLGLSNHDLWPQVQAMPLNGVTPKGNAPARGCSAVGFSLAPTALVLLLAGLRRRDRSVAAETQVRA